MDFVRRVLVRLFVVTESCSSYNTSQSSSACLSYCICDQAKREQARRKHRRVGAQFSWQEAQARCVRRLDSKDDRAEVDVVMLTIEEEEVRK